jgi:hypothetical protein
MKVHGGCHCQRIRFEADADETRAAICHCTDCQVLGGSAYRVSVPTTRSEFHLKQGAPKEYTKTADSGRRRVQGFCSHCGTAIYSRAAEGTQMSLRVGCIDERASIRPAQQIWCGSALPWSDDLRQIPTRSGE